MNCVVSSFKPRSGSVFEFFAWPGVEGLGAKPLEVICSGACFLLCQQARLLLAASGCHVHIKEGEALCDKRGRGALFQTPAGSLSQLALGCTGTACSPSTWPDFGLLSVMVVAMCPQMLFT